MVDYKALRAVLEPVRRDAEVLLTFWEFERDIDGKEIWQATVGGILSVPDGLTAEFQFRVLIVGQRLRRGTSWTPDWFRITGPDGTIIFEGDVESPDGPNDAAGWERYDAFTAIRVPAFDAVFARLATGRPVVDPPN